MDFQIRFSETALAGLNEIFAYSWAHFPEATEHFGAALYELKRFPFMGSPVARRPGVRQLVHTPILIYYRVWEEDRIIEILEVRHAARK